MSSIQQSFTSLWVGVLKEDSRNECLNQLSKVCDFLQKVQLFSLFGYSGMNVYNQLEHKNILPLINNGLGKTQLIDGLGVFQLPENICRMKENFCKNDDFSFSLAFELCSDLSSMFADILYFPMALDELNLINLHSHVEKIGKISLFKWLPNYTLDRSVNFWLFQKYFHQFFNGVTQGIEIYKDSQITREVRTKKIQVVFWKAMVGLTEGMYYLSTLRKCRQKHIDRFMLIAKMTGILSVFLMPKIDV